MKYDKGRLADIPYPYIMDPPQVERKVGPMLDLKDKKKLQAIIVEQSKLHYHCHMARGLCSYNVGQIIDSKDPVDYPEIVLPPPPPPPGK